MADNARDYVLVNVLFGFVLGRIKRNGKIGKRPKYYKTPIAVFHAYNKLNLLQRMVIKPAKLDFDTMTYQKIEFEFEET